VENTKGCVMIKVWDDLIPKYLQDYYELITLGVNGEEFVHPTVDFRCKYESTAEEEQLTHPPLSFVHILKSNTRVSEHLDNFGMIAQAACANNSLTLKDIMVARIYITVPYDTELKHYAPHVDYPGKHTVVIYYVNDADGPTVFFDKNNNIVQSVEPKKGRVVMFDGEMLHGGGIPKKGPRCIINFDLWT
jgi:hypothetical protein